MNKTDSLSIDIDINIAMDIEQLINGGFYPLNSFMNLEQLESVLHEMRLPSGEVWSIPILFPKYFTNSISSVKSLVVRFENKELAVLEDLEEFEYDVDKLVKYLYGTTSSEHPGVIQTKKYPKRFVTGKLHQIEKLPSLLKVKSLEPTQIKNIIKERGWKNIVGFHTRNPPHRAHEYIHTSVLKGFDGLLIHPVIGSKKRGDFSTEAIMQSYKLYVKKYLPKERIILTPLLTYSRYGGPREALFTAIIRRNYGCTHFVVGRDHTGVKNFYGKYDSQKIFKNFDDIGIEIINFSEPFYCKKSRKITTKKECPHGDKYYVEVSGTRIRQAILEKSKLPEFFIRKDILKTLQNIKNIFVE